MPTSWSAKEERQYEHIKVSELRNGKSKDEAQRIAAATVNKQRVRKSKVEKAFMKPNIIKAEGSRGGVVIGRTRTGKAIYAPSNKMVTSHKEKRESERSGKPLSTAHHTKHSKAGQEHHSSHDAFFQGWSGEDHRDAAQVHNDAARAHTNKHGWGSHHSAAHRSLANTHESMQTVHNRHARSLPHDHATVVRDKHQTLDYTNEGPGVAKSTMKPDVTKARIDNKEISMSNENEEGVDEIFKSVLGDTTEPVLTHCVHCNEGLSKSDLQKGLSTHFVKDDNDQPHSGGKGSVPNARAGAGAKENDIIAPLLKGEDQGDAEQFYISKSEMAAMGMDVSGIECDSTIDLIITKGEMTRLGASQHVPYLRGRKLLDINKSVEPGVGVQRSNIIPEPPLVEDNVTPQHAAIPSEELVTKSGVGRGGMAHSPHGSPLVVWADSGDDEAIAKSIETESLGQGSDEPIRGRKPYLTNLGSQTRR